MGMNLEDNDATIEALKKGDEKAFEELFLFFYPRLFAFCSHYSSRHEAEEIVQETMMWLWENRTALMPGFSLQSLLFTIVKNKALNALSHHEMRERVHEEIAHKFEETFDNPDLYTHSELLSLYNKALHNMPEEYREALLLNRRNNLSHKEIATRLNVSPQTINYRICQALKFLRKELKDYLPMLF